MIYVLDLSGRAVFFSADWEATTGQPLAEALGHGWLDRIHADDRSRVQQAVGRACSERLPFVARCRMLAAHPSPVWISCGATPCFWPARRAYIGWMGAVTVLQDQSISDPWMAVGVSASLDDAGQPSSPLDLARDHLLAAKTLVQASSMKPAIEAIELTLFLLDRRGPRTDRTDG